MSVAGGASPGAVGDQEDGAESLSELTLAQLEARQVQPGRENRGRWTEEEHQVFIEALKEYGKNWRVVAGLIGTRTVVQVRTHAQKYFQKLVKKHGGHGDTSTAATPRSEARGPASKAKVKTVGPALGATTSTDAPLVPRNPPPLCGGKLHGIGGKGAAFRLSPSMGLAPAPAPAAAAVPPFHASSASKEPVQEPPAPRDDGSTAARGRRPAPAAPPAKKLRITAPSLLNKVSDAKVFSAPQVSAPAHSASDANVDVVPMKELWADWEDNFTLFLPELDQASAYTTSESSDSETPSAPASPFTPRGHTAPSMMQAPTFVDQLPFEVDAAHESLVAAPKGVHVAPASSLAMDSQETDLSLTDADEAARLAEFGLGFEDDIGFGTDSALDELPMADQDGLIQSFFVHDHDLEVAVADIM